MPITFTTPIATADLTVRRLVHFGANVTTRTIICDFETGALDAGGAFMKVEEHRRTFTDETTPSFADFIAACPAAGNLRRQTEQYETTLDRAGTVD